MWAELRGIVSAIANEHLRGLLNAFLDDPDVAARYQVAPAAKSIHHAFRSGLLEHVVSLLKLGKLVGRHYGAVDVDLLSAGIVLHDIGKIHELSYERGFNYSAEGQLLGHIAIAIRMIADKLRAFPDFPVELRNLIEHMVLSHHGQLEFGSPKLPIFPEALLLHYLDDMDSKMENMRALIAKDPQSEGYFSAYSSALGRVALRKARYLEKNPAGSQLDAAPDGDLDISSNGNHSNNIYPSTASETTAPIHNGGLPMPAPSPKPAPATSSIFGAKLQQALLVDTTPDERK
jgi:3'-5' exoribonuclease